MIDTAKITVEGGRGGDGCVSFRREKYVAKGGPDGGDGGRGGDIFLRATREKNTLVDQNRQHSYKAENGGAGSGNNRHGKNGEDLTIDLPLGTVVFDSHGQTLFDLTHEGQMLKVAEGGKGGYGNKRFASPTHQIPRERTEGEKGDKETLSLELKLMADVGLVGLPNAGKSTLIASITHAKPKIADYPFSSLEPILGVGQHKGVTYTVADIPGLIEGASHGKGLGVGFLKHIERTRIIIHLIRADSINPKKDYQTIRTELESFSEKLAKKKEIIAITHSDVVDKSKIKENFSNRLFDKAITISAPTHENIDALQDDIIQLLGKSPK